MSLCPEDYLPVVRRLALRAYLRIPASAGTMVELGDLESAGTIGLMQALERYDVDSAASVTTFVSARINGAILDYLREIDVVARTHRCSIQDGLLPPPTAISLDLLLQDGDNSDSFRTVWADALGQLSSQPDANERARLERVVAAAVAQLPYDMAQVVQRHLMAGEPLRRLARERSSRGQRVTVKQLMQVRRQAIKRLRELLREEME